MALPGPQLGGISLIVHIAVIIVFAIRNVILKSCQRIFRPNRPNAKLQNG